MALVPDGEWLCVYSLMAFSFSDLQISVSIDNRTLVAYEVSVLLPDALKAASRHLAMSYHIEGNSLIIFPWLARFQLFLLKV